MRVAIHVVEHYNSFSIKWIEYCKKNNIDYIVVDCFASNIIQVLRAENITHLLIHFLQVWKDLLAARSVIYSAGLMGIKTFPNFNTCWHFDDKISQKYLMESLSLQFVNTQVFYNKQNAKKWCNESSNFPIVAKLRRGSGSNSVRLIKNKSQFNRYVNRMFSSGILPLTNQMSDLTKRLISIKKWGDILEYGNRLKSRVMQALRFKQIIPKEFGYVYVQDFIPGNSFDIRVIVIGSRAFGIKRMVRKNDFRASGSGNIIYDHDQIDVACVKRSFDAARKLEVQAVAIDYIFNYLNEPLITEISYGFTPRAYDKCEGFWDTELNFHPGTSILEFCIIEDLLEGDIC